jgi:2-polyprenyl-3-methyl-5-hydroxy-6-metoxy-1,4-benzoquinol methylase
LSFNERYFNDLNYSQRALQIKENILNVLKWASNNSNYNLLNGKNKTALDVGCAYGYAIEVLNSLGYTSFGIDISKFSLQKAKNEQNGRFFLSDVNHFLPFREKVFDLITCFEVLEHLKNPIHTIDFMLASCKKVMICTTPNRFIEKPIRKIIGDFDKTHITTKTPWEWTSLLKNKTKISKIETFIDLSLNVSNKILFFKSFMIPYFGLNIRILMQK